MSALRFVKLVGCFEWSCIVKWVIFLGIFCWLWTFLLENLKLKDRLQIWGFESIIFYSKFHWFFLTVLVRFRLFNFCFRLVWSSAWLYVHSMPKVHSKCNRTKKTCKFCTTPNSSAAIQDEGNCWNIFNIHQETFK